jgi:A/G-specific adenine glycosylase
MISVDHKKKLFIRSLRRWHLKHQRSYPWRDTKKPYKILISEFLLQKTNADMALSVYKILIKKYPTPKILANAKISELKQLISSIGLSYRADRMIKMARQLIHDFNAQVPNNRQDLLKLYGVGPYISNAVLCFAYNKRVAIIDTNTIRIFGRIFKIESGLKRARTDRNLEKQFEAFLPNQKIREFNYALLDFGATICTAKKPKCNKCPLSNLCIYYQENTVLLIDIVSVQDFRHHTVE